MDDFIWHFKHTNILLDIIKGATLIQLDGTGHELHLEDWENIIAGISKHVKDHNL